MHRRDVYDLFYDRTRYPCCVYYAFEDPRRLSAFTLWCESPHVEYVLDGTSMISLQTALTTLAVACQFPHPEFYHQITPDGAMDRMSDLDGSVDGRPGHQLVFFYQNPLPLYRANVADFVMFIDILFEGMLRLFKWHPATNPALFIAPVSTAMYGTCMTLRSALCSTLIQTEPRRR